MTNQEMKSLIEDITTSYPDLEIDINYQIPYISIGIFYTQGDDAINLLKEAEKASEKFDVTIEDYLIFYLNSAGVL